MLKVPSVRETEQNYDEQDACFILKRDEKGQIVGKMLKSATLERTLDYLCFDMADEANFDANFISVFFSTYPSFVDTATLMAMIRDRYMKAADYKNSALLNHILRIFLFWMKNCKTMAPSKKVLFKQQNEFTSFFTILLLTHQNAVKKKLIEDEVCATTTNYEELNNTSIGIASLIFNTPKCGKNEKRYSDLFSINEWVIAEQLTLKDAWLLRHLNISDCLGSIWGKRHKWSKDIEDTISPTIEHFNFVCTLVSNTITSFGGEDCRTGSKRQAKVIEHWIKVGEILLEFGNISSLKAVVATLSSENIFRLKKAWQSVHKQKLKEYEKLQCLVLSNNAKRSRTCYSNQNKLQKKGSYKKKDRNNSNQGYIPFLGQFLTELISIDEMHPSFEDGRINFVKKRKEFDVLAELILYVSSVKMYSFKYDSSFYLWASLVVNKISTFDNGRTALREARKLAGKLIPTTPANELKRCNTYSMNRTMQAKSIEQDPNLPATRSNKAGLKIAKFLTKLSCGLKDIEDEYILATILVHKEGQFAAPKKVHVNCALTVEQIIKLGLSTYKRNKNRLSDHQLYFCGNSKGVWLTKKKQPLQFHLTNVQEPWAVTLFITDDPANQPALDQYILNRDKQSGPKMIKGSNQRSQIRAQTQA